jgi:hypothetical protein
MGAKGKLRCHQIVMLSGYALIPYLIQPSAFCMLVSLPAYRDAIIRLFRAEAVPYLKTDMHGVPYVPSSRALDNAMADRGAEALDEGNKKKEQECRAAYDALDGMLYPTAAQTVLYEAQYGTQPFRIFSDDLLLLKEDAALQKRVAEGLKPYEAVCYRKMVQALYEDNGEGLQRLALHTHLSVDKVDLFARYFALSYSQYDQLETAMDATLIESRKHLGISGSDMKALMKACASVLDEGKSLEEVTPKRHKVALMPKILLGTIVSGLVIAGGYGRLQKDARAEESRAARTMTTMRDHAFADADAPKPAMIPNLLAPIYREVTAADSAAAPQEWGNRIKAEAAHAQIRRIEK